MKFHEEERILFWEEGMYDPKGSLKVPEKIPQGMFTSDEIRDIIAKRSCKPDLTVDVDYMVGTVDIYSHSVRTPSGKPARIEQYTAMFAPRNKQTFQDVTKGKRFYYEERWWTATSGMKRKAFVGFAISVAEQKEPVTSYSPDSMVEMPYTKRITR